jgi:hypothetical protein
MNEIIVKAFLKVQSEFPEIPRDSTGSTGNRSYKYASLPAIQKVCFPILHENGFAVSQVFAGESLETRIMHTSGECLISYLDCSDEGLSPQKFGSKITYYRRYALVAALGLAPDEDVDAAGIDTPAKKKKVWPKLKGELPPVAYDDVVDPPAKKKATNTSEKVAAAPKTRTSEPTTEESEQDEKWDSDIPDDILEIVKENYKIIKKRGEDANTWHKRVLANFMGVKEDGSAVDVIKGLDRQQLWDLSQLQNDRIKINGED